MNLFEETTRKIEASMKQQLSGGETQRGNSANREMIADYIDHFGFERARACG